MRMVEELEETMDERKDEREYAGTKNVYIGRYLRFLNANYLLEPSALKSQTSKE